MRVRRPSLWLLAICALLVALGVPIHHVAKEKTPPVSPDDPTLKLYQLLDTSYGGKLADFIVIGDVFKDPKNPDKELQHIFKAEYDKTKGYGKFRLYVRSVDKLTPGQLKDYTPQQIYDFGNEDVEKFGKTDPGPFGRAGDLFFQATAEGTLATAPITDEVRKEYETYITQWLMPALEKK